MNFIEAIKEVEKGNKVRLKIWDKDTHIKKADNGNFTIFYGNKQLSQTTHTEILLNSMGWEIFKLAEKLHTFEEALAAYKCGKTIYREGEDNQFNINDTNVSSYHYNNFRRKDLLANDWIIEEKL